MSSGAQARMSILGRDVDTASMQRAETPQPSKAERECVQDDEPAPGDMDWASADQVSSHVSRSTLHGMQQLWRQHATAMDGHGKNFAGDMLKMHSLAIKDVAMIKNFELKPVLALLNNFTTAVRESVLGAFSTMREQDDMFAQQLYQTARRNFSRNLKDAMEARDAWYQDKLKSFKSRHEGELTLARGSAAVELRQQEAHLRKEMAQEVAMMEAKYKVALAEAEIKAAVAAALLGVEGQTLVAQAMAEVAAKAANAPQPSLGGELGGEMRRVEASASIDGVKKVGGTFDDMCSDDVRNKTAVLQAKVDELTANLAQEKELVSNWKNKWAQESTKTDGIKKECLQIVTKCEDHVRGLQQKHVGEMSQRDYILQRCKDTITRLEAKLAEATGGAEQPSLMVQVPASFGKGAGKYRP